MNRSFQKQKQASRQAGKHPSASMRTGQVRSGSSGLSWGLGSGHGRLRQGKAGQEKAAQQCTSAQVGLEWSVRGWTGWLASPSVASSFFYFLSFSRTRSM
ncbi:hypothetical protein AXG93_3105s1130 [Marchantia polymorpha subsp. ruderalis]|uniref:Uncharacterized protein n=1 Tax=Marchantia polymorpha subsp. ruderalis TaxID=1480154 RepID=A0A176WLU1_MARPO|nr:hypothetical protein AXG93_3105s1130 [Marchantia polymorpha subsp. ruderalis]